jgi:signal transduction histidine kinase
MDSEVATLSTLSRPEQLLSLACLVARADVGGVGLLSAQGELVEHFTTGLTEETVVSLRCSAWPVSLVQFVLRQPGPVSLSGWPTEASPKRLTLPALGSFLAVPLTCPGRCRGVLYLGRLPGGKPFDTTNMQAVQGIGRFLEQGSLFEEARLMARMRLLNQVAQTAAGNLELGPILQDALRELDRLLPTQVCAVWLVENSNADEAAARPQASAARFSSAFSDAPPLPVSVPQMLPQSGSPIALVLAETTAGPGGLAPGVRLDLVTTPFGPCVHDGEPIFADLDRPPFSSERILEPVVEDKGLSGGLRSSLSGIFRRAAPSSKLQTPHSELSLGVPGAACFCAVPLRAGDRTVGILHSVCLRPSGFSADQVQLFHLVADLLGPAISNCQLFGRLSSAYEMLRQTQNQLVQTEKMRALGELAGGMAHDFNNALCGALGFLELTLRNNGLPIAARSHLESARVCCLDAAQTVSRVQDFARRRCDGSIHLLELDALVHQTIEVTRHKWESLDHARGTPIQIEVRTESNASVTGSPNELREVLTNLVFNAVDAMPEGGTLTVRTWTDGPSVFLAVRDTGPGIPEAVQRRLFEPFFTTKGERGNGLGLSVSFGIVRRHAGEITVLSQPDHGTTFTVRLPIHAPVIGAPAGDVEKKRDAPIRSLPSANGKSLRVLVVDDQESIRNYLGMGLTSMGHRPVMAGTVAEALDLFGRQPFDVVLTDLGLPEVSGEELARSVRRRSPTTPVIVLTGWAEQLQADGTALEGVDRVLAKPVTLATLATTLASVCK